jgi:hypothetical protein
VQLCELLDLHHVEELKPVLDGPEGFLRGVFRLLRRLNLFLVACTLDRATEHLIDEFLCNFDREHGFVRFIRS